jgi:esterase/lipase
MIRTGYQIFNYNKLAKGYLPISGVYMSKKEAEINMSALSFLDMKIEKVIIVENEQSIDDFYNQIEQENPAYQAALTEVITEALSDIENNNFDTSNPYVDKDGIVSAENTKNYLRYLSNEALELNWLNKVSICGGD